MEWIHDTHEKPLTKGILLGTILISVLPLILLLSGVNFASPIGTAELEGLTKLPEDAIHDTLLRAFTGAFVHLILEWSGVIIAMATAVLAFVQYRITGNSATPIIGMALLSAGFMDAFHALSATQIINSVSDNSDFIPFTWGLSRTFKALILLVGVAIFILGLYRKSRRRNRLVLISSLGFLITSYILIRICATSSHLPSTQFPNQWITRPFDVAPLVLFIVLALWALPKFQKKEKSIFSQALIWSMIPAIATQLHMVFGSSELHDSHFNIAHFLKTISYVVPFVGITVDYLSTYRTQKIRLREIALARNRLEAKNKELNQISYATSHDLQEPLRTLVSMCDLLKMEYGGKFDELGEEILGYITQSSQRMSDLVKDLMMFNQVGQTKEISKIDCNEIVRSIKVDLAQIISENKATIESTKLPTIYGYETEIRLLFQNLISNSIKFKNKNRPLLVSIDSTENDTHWSFSVTDNGIGIAPEYQVKVFQIFQKLSHKGEYDGTGVGLAHSKKIIDHHDGRIWVESDGIEGCTFHFTIPKKN